MSQNPKKKPPVDQRRLLDALLRQNLSAFIERCFNEVEAVPYRHNWHIDALAHALSQVEAGVAHD